MAESSSAQQRTKKYHKRSTWACDECKLRKKKCDAGQPCRSCTVYRKECTYESRTRPSQPPTQRIRDLEEYIRTVRDMLGRMKGSLSGNNLVEVDQMLELLKPAADISSQDDSPLSESVTPDSIRSMLAGRGRLFETNNKTFFHGPYSGPAFICCVLESFEGTDTRAMHPFITELFDKTGPMLSDEIATLPDKPRAIALFTNVMMQSHPFFHFLDATSLRSIMEANYDDLGARADASNSVIGLCHIVLALGYLISTDDHREYGCDSAIAQSYGHFSASRERLELTAVDESTQLQTIICTIIFLVSTSRLSSAYAYISIGSISAIKQGLHMRAGVATRSSSSSRPMEEKILTALVNLDLYVSTILGLPPLVNIDTAGATLEPNTLEPTTSESSKDLPRTISLFSSQVGRANLEGSAGDPYTKFCQIVSLTASVLWEFSACPTDEMTDPNNATSLVNATILGQAEKDLATWTKNLGVALSPSTSDDDDVPIRVAVAKHELEIAYYWSQMLIYLPFLHYIRPLAAGQHIPESHSRPALTCLKIAVNTIVRCEVLLQSLKDSESYTQFMHPSNWSCIYTVFLAVLALLFLISVHEGTGKPSEAWHKAEIGIKILAALRCDEGCASRCLAVIKELVRQLSDRVDFDIESIEESTRKVVCERQKYADQMGVDGETFADRLKRIFEPVRASSGGFVSSADRMLAKAQDMPLTAHTISQERD